MVLWRPPTLLSPLRPRPETCRVIARVSLPPTTRRRLSFSIPFTLSFTPHIPDLAAVDVINPATGQVVRQIPVPDTVSLSLSPDGTRILATGITQQVAWIDTSSEQIAGRDILPSCTCSTQFVSPGSSMIMANGEILFSGLLEWSPSTSQVTQMSPSNFSAGQDTIGVRTRMVRWPYFPRTPSPRRLVCTVQPTVSHSHRPTVITHLLWPPAPPTHNSLSP